MTKHMLQSRSVKFST